ncbi:MAG: class I SAM-dependent methyltransferase [Candidatus Poribacteria bacterium]|nr:class I SAM-dependent methyltransferase [Candidatus Poribacteria bacterium]
MSELWKTSQWARLNDWDWLNQPMPESLRDVKKRIAETFPVKFFYHMLEFARLDPNARDGAHFVRNEGEFRFVEYDPISAQLIQLFRTPRTIDRIRSSDMLTRLETLKQHRLIVPADKDEPVDCLAVFYAAITLFGIWQVEHEFVPALQRIADLRPKRVIEIGTGWGGSMFSWAQVADPTARLVTIDLPWGPGSLVVPTDYYPRFQQFKHADQTVKCILADSDSDEALKYALEWVDGDSVDFLFIDGDHSYEGVRSDYERYHGLVRPGGLIMFHDVFTPDGGEYPEGLGVAKFWNEIRSGFEHEEFMLDQNIGVPLGIGILNVPE